MNLKNKKAFVIGFIFGLIAPAIGLFLGLQIAPLLGNILIFPFLVISKIIDTPIGNWSLVLKIVGVIFSMIIWGLLFASASSLFKK